VILLHEGGFSNGSQNDCGTAGLSGPLAQIVPAFDDAVDVVIAGHVNDEFICEVDGKLVTMADTAGRLFTDIDVTLNRVTKDLTVVAVNNVPNLQSAADDPEVQALIDKYNTLSAPLANTVIGSVSTDITRVDDADGESPLGEVIADAQLAATAPAGFGEAVAAFMNKGGVRDEIDFAASGSEQPGEVTFGEAFSVQPFGNSLVTMTLTGAQIDTLLEQQFQGAVSRLDVSEGFTYSWSASAPAGAKVSSIAINGVPVEPTVSYRVTVNSFLADGGDNYPILIQGTNRLGGDVDLDALVDYFNDNSPVAPGPQDRVTMVP
jgi:5'-nucleotidase